MKLNRKMLATKPSGIRKIGQLARQHEGCIALSIGEPDLDAPESVRSNISKAILAGDTHYPPNPGIPALRRELAHSVSQRFHADYTAENTLITIGSTEALASALFAILNPGDEVIVPIPSFGLYQPQIEMAGGVYVPMDISGSDYQVTADQLAALITDRTAAILFASPNNPTGTIQGKSALEAIKAAALAHDLYIIDDSVYDQLVYIPEFPTLMGDPELRDRLIYVNAFSKTYAMTGVRIGYALADLPVMEQMIKVHSFLVVSAPGFVQTGCLSITDIANSESVRLYQSRLTMVMQALDAIGLPYPEPRGAFYIFPDISQFGIPDETFCTRLIEEAGLALVPSSCFGVPDHVRISFCYDTNILEAGMKRLASFVYTLRNA
ncbi:MAG: aminotransferase class I/II-fold pyridoxal phosphate-dependent enzyme [Clostridia bacterium]|nr:aminotransferase class I/II-fold pyridoxal phosphate-dependent enzyme [Clostridia bacterium]